MTRFIVDNIFWEKFPNAKVGVVICNNIDNLKKTEEYYKNLLLSAMKESQKHIENPDFSKNEVIKIWREAFREFKTKKGARSSIEALLKRVQNGNNINTINPLVDIYNSISLKYAVPCGGEESDPPYQGEIIYKDDAGAICRCLNWRESKRTMLTENTKNALMCMESINEESGEILKEALNELSKLIEVNLGAKTEIFILNKDNFKIEFEV